VLYALRRGGVEYIRNRSAPLFSLILLRVENMAGSFNIYIASGHFVHAVGFDNKAGAPSVDTVLRKSKAARYLRSRACLYLHALRRQGVSCWLVAA
jgi:hypothetical protein